MKQTLKSIIPRLFMNMARDIKDRPGLKALNPLMFNCQNLIPAEKVNLPDVFSNKDIQKDWEKDHKEIIALFGNEDKLGGVNPGDRKALYYLIRSIEPENILEIGTHIGASTLHLASALKHGKKKCTITSVDICDVNDLDSGAWKKAGIQKPPRELAKDLLCDDIITFVASRSLEFMKDNTEKTYDFIFLDGDHSAGAVYQEISASLSILKKDGYILLHDYYPNKKALFPDKNIISGPYNAIERIKGEQTNIAIMPLGTLPWQTKQGTHNTSLALIVKK